MSQMALTVEEMLQLPILQNARIISGNRGLHNEVRYIDIMEIPDMAGWLRQHEFVLTTGYAFHNNPWALCKLLDEMHQVGGAAIGVKQRRFFYEISDQATQRSNEYGIPLIDIPPEITSIDITHTVMENILNKQFAMLRQERDINSTFMQLILHRRGTEIVTVLSNLLNCEVAVLKKNGAVLCTTPGFHQSHVMLTRDIVIGNALAGYLQMTREPTADDLFAHICINQALTVLALELTIQDTAQHRKEHAREDFLIELLAGTTLSDDAIMYRARLLDFPIVPFYTVLLIKPLFSSSLGEHTRNDLWEQIRMVIFDTINADSKRQATASIGEFYAVLCSSSRSNLHKSAGQHLAPLLYKRLQNKLPDIDFYIGLGSMVDKLTRINESYTQAVRAIDAGTKVHPDRHIIYYQDVYVEDMLFSIKHHPALMMLYNLLLLPVYQYDVENGTELFKTLESTIRLGGNTRKVAEELFLHRNSVNYRLERIQHIIGVNLFDPEVRLRLDLLFRAWKLQILPPHTELLFSSTPSEPHR
jgi:purine catabolism regulator